MENITKIINHMELLGYEFQKAKNSDNYIGKSELHGPVMLVPVGGSESVKLETWCPMNKNSTKKRLQYLSMINEINIRMIATTAYATDDGLHTSTLYIGRYDKKIFSNLIEAYHFDIRTFYSHDDAILFSE